MDTKVTRNLAVLFFSGCIGGLVAYSVVAWLWWLGIIVGGLCGYLICNPKGVAVGAKTAWRLIETQKQDFISFMKTMMYVLGAICSFTVRFAAFIGIGFSTLIIWSMGLNVMVHWGWFANTQEVSTIVVYVAVSYFILYMVLIVEFVFEESLRENKLFFASAIAIPLFVAVMAYIPTLQVLAAIITIAMALVPFAILAVIGLTVSAIALVVAGGLCWLGYHFLRWLIKLIHSDERVACMAFSAGGVAIAHYLTASIWVVLLSGLCAAGLGWLDYKLAALWNKQATSH